MSEVEFNKNYRKIWMFPRNIRRITPWKSAQILQLIITNLESTEWKNDQEFQNKLYYSLVDLGVKKSGSVRDIQSGGMRTYFSQMKCLGLIFKSDYDHCAYPTIAGSIIMNNEENSLEAFQSVLFRHQYPSNYSIGQNIKIHPKIRIKPFLFIMQLLHDKELDNYITSDELLIPVVYGHNNGCYEKCKRKILNIRNGSSVFSQIDDRVKDLYTPRGSGKNAFSNAVDIANTAKNYLQGALLIDTFKHSITGKESISFNRNYESAYRFYLNEAESFVPHEEREESFQRSYGRFDKVKDTRKLTRSEYKISEDSLIKSHLISYAEKTIIPELSDEIIDNLYRKYGFNKERIIEAAEPMLANNLSVFENNYLVLSHSGARRSTDFEKATEEIFKKRLDFETAHTGQKKRTGENVGGYADIFLLAKDRIHCGLVDTKASASYNISSDDYYKMANNYIKSYRELCSENRKARLEFCLYVAGGFYGDNQRKLDQLFNETNIRTSIISASNLLKLSNSDKNDDQSFVRKVLKKGTEITYKDFR